MSTTALRERPGQPAQVPEGRRGGVARVPRDVELDDKYRLEDGRIILTGVQALVRLTLDQHRADRRRGLTTGTLVSGYQGSPLGGLDKELQRNRELCDEHHVRHVPGLNEELGATSAWGSQLASRLPGSRYDGVLALWYGKAPGLDRAADALRHGNMVGVSRTGGALAVAGDDPAAKSSTIPSASESVLASLHMPVFFPGSVQDVLDLGLHAYACSRASGLWSGFKVVTNVADAIATADVSPDRVLPLLPDLGYEHQPSASLLPPTSLDLERTLVGVRTDLALEYARLNDVNRVEGARDGWLGIVCAGKGYYDVRHALRELGLDDDALERAGVRLLKLGMIWPLEPTIVRSFARGLDEILVVEEKLPFVESQLKEALYGEPDAPRVVGKRDEHGAPLLPATGDLDADGIARVVAARLALRVHLDGVDERLRRLDEIDGRRGPLPMAARMPFFCSGCPHNTSTAAPDGTLVGAGIGCHTMVVLAPDGKGDLTGLTQMGGEGAQWIGQAPFTDDRHLVQNLGDGTFHHSGSLAIRAAVAAGVNITYKLLYNEHVAMTGGQAIEGQLSVPDLTRWLELEGVRRVIVTTEDTSRYKGVKLAGIAELRERGALLDAQRELAEVEGVTVLIHDQECAAEKRRKRKRGQQAEPAERVWINERVCEGCGDCGKKSNCLSVMPVETEFGRKTRIHQASCNKDYSCVEGDCPSFVTVVPGWKAKRRAPVPPALPEPTLAVAPTDYAVRMLGIGGTGVVTINQILGTAALIDGLHVSGLDQTGLSQKGGPVTSDLRFSARPLAAASKLPAGSVDLYLGFDLLGAAAAANLRCAHPSRTTAVVSTSAVPTGQMVVNPAVRFPELSDQLDLIDGAAGAHGGNLYFDAQAVSEQLFGDHMPANMLVLGAAYQRGLLPVSGAAIGRAIRLNGAAVEKNLAAFDWGRAIVASPDAVRAGEEPGSAEPRDLVAELTAYQGAGYAREYEDAVAHVREQAPALADAVARNLFKLMAYKDEYEVARLHLDAFEQARLRAEFGEEAKVWINLHPPLLRALGLKRKLKLGRWFTPALRLLRAMRRVRGTPLDPFGYAKVRRVERGLPAEYLELVDVAVAHADDPAALELCELPDVIRGYEEIKLRNVALFRTRAKALRKRAERGGDALHLTLVS